MTTAASDEDIALAADWLRHRPGETDRAWIERVGSALDPRQYEGMSQAELDRMDRTAERRWQRAIARKAADRGST